MINAQPNLPEGGWKIQNAQRQWNKMHFVLVMIS